ncbi:MAG: MarR family transcriptional regulator, partial [Leptospiraceae bacterium]|nr:MarR family transcriptional regulator [Leptospiraceae bacterium]
ALDLYIKLSRAEATVTMKGLEILDNSGLSLGQFGILETIYHLGPLVQKDIATKHLSTGANITQLLNKLEEKKMIVRQRDSQDKRRLYINLTDKGKKLMKQLIPSLGKKMVSIMSPLNSTEQKQLSGLLKKLGTHPN